MATYRVWLDYKTWNEADDGENYDAESAQSAVKQFADARYAELQHVDPGRVFVRCPDGSVERWNMGARVTIDVWVEPSSPMKGDAT